MNAALCAGHMDHGQADIAGRAALRPRVELLPGAAARPDAVSADAAPVSRDAGRRRLQRHRPALRRGVRPVRQREDGAQSERRPVSRDGRRRQRQLLGAPPLVSHPDERDPDDGPTPNKNFTPDCNLQNPLANGECAADQQPELRCAERPAQPVVRSGDPARLGHAAERLDHRRDGPARAAAARVAHRSATRGAGSRTSPSPTTSPWPRRTTRRSA